NQKMNDWLEEKYEGILELKLNTLRYLEFFINKKHSIPKQIEDFLFRYSTDLFQRVPWKTINSDYENYKSYISIQTNLIKKNRVRYERIIDIFIKNKKKMNGRKFNFLLISQLLNPIPREIKQSQFLLSTLLKNLATDRISDYQYFFKEIINNLLQAISGIPDPTLKEEMLSLLYASIWDYDKDFITELGEFAKPDNQHHNIDKEILKEITNLAAIASKAKEGAKTLFRKVELENLSE
ncbi:TPA: hypothetical protein U0K61_002208, partial [Streptococcus suis]|nr:hypothetical protein [Streptococcus suis]